MTDPDSALLPSWYNNWENVFSLIFDDKRRLPLPKDSGDDIKGPLCWLLGKDLVDKLARRVTTGAYLCLLTDDTAGDHEWIKSSVLKSLRPYRKTTNPSEIVMLHSHITLNIQNIISPAETTIVANPNKLFDIVKVKKNPVPAWSLHIDWEPDEDLVSYLCESGYPCDDKHVREIRNSHPFYGDESRGVIEGCEIELALPGGRLMKREWLIPESEAPWQSELPPDEDS